MAFWLTVCLMFAHKTEQQVCFKKKKAEKDVSGQTEQQLY